MEKRKRCIFYKIFNNICKEEKEKLIKCTQNPSFKNEKKPCLEETIELMSKMEEKLNAI